MQHPIPTAEHMFGNRWGMTQSVEPLLPTPRQPYVGDMAVSAHAIAAAIRERQPGIGAKKLHKLLYYAQGYHLAAFGEPLFHESISAWDMGPVVGALWKAEKAGAPTPKTPALRERELRTVGYILSRYGLLSAQELEDRTHAEMPWQRANSKREPGGSARIQIDWLREYFAAQASQDEPSIDSPQAQRMLEETRRRIAAGDLPQRPDRIEEIRAWLAANA